MAKRIDWKAMYEDVTHPEVGDTLTAAKDAGLRYYRNSCPRHGATIYCVLDNTCPLCVRAQAVQRRKDRPLYNRAREKYSELKRRAVEKGFGFNLTVDVIREMMESTTTCPILGIPLSIGSGVLSDNSPSMDRFDSSIGYEVGNVFIISHRANKIKNDATPEELRAIADWMDKIKEQK